MSDRFGRLRLRYAGWFELSARNRVRMGFVAAGIVLWLARPTLTTIRLGGTIAAIGEALRIWAAGHLNKSREVTASGPYRWTAHPLYIGSAIMAVGLAIACASAPAAALIGVYLVVTFSAAVATEEHFLSRRFGDEYDRYRRGAAHDGSDRTARRFSVAQALANREHRALVGLLLVVLLLAWKATYNEVFWRSVRGAL